MKKGIRFFGGLSGVLLIAAIVVAVLLSDRMEENHSVSQFPVSIHEVMASNTRYMNDYGICCDYVELYNSSSSAINISGYKLTDKNSEARFSVPDGTVLPAGGYYVIYCMQDADPSRYANFGISKDGGETITLMNQRNVLVDTVTTVALGQNEVMARQPDGTFAVSADGTPGFSNDAVGYAAYLESRADASDCIEISEILASNSFYTNADGILSDFVELHNTATQPVGVGGYMLSDNAEVFRYVIPENTVIPADGYLVISCSREHTGPYYANFSISRSGGEEILLLNAAHQVVDRMQTVSAQKNMPMVRDGLGGVETMEYATPGYANTQEGFRNYLISIGAHSDLRINELMTSNSHYPDANGRLYDWIELYNGGTAACDLSGWGLSDAAGDARYRFPEGTVVEAGTYFTVYCDSAAMDETVAPFGLAADGEELVVLTDANGGAVDAVLTLAAPTNYAQVRNAQGILEAMAMATPGFANTEAGQIAYQQSEPAAVPTVRIAEWMPANAATLADEDGVFSDYVELENTGNAPVALGLLYLSDSQEDPYQFRLPERTLEAGERVLIFCSGKDRVDGQIHASFGLAKGGDSLYLTTAYGTCIDSVSYSAAEDDRAFVRDVNGKVSVTPYATPGYPNDEKGYGQFMDSRMPVQNLAISEVMPSNRTYLRHRGEYYDWVELVNLSDKEINIGGYMLSDSFANPDRCVLPSVELEPGETFVVLCSGDTSLSTDEILHASFAVDSVEETVYLFSQDGTLLDYVHVFDVPVGGSIGRPKGRNGFALFETPSPKSENSSGGYSGIPSEMPISDVAPGVYENQSKLKVSLSGSGAIYYTLDGSEPTEKSRKYEAPITVDKTTVIRAVCIEPNRLASEILTLSYFLNEGHSLPVVSLVMDPEDFSGSDGIYSNPLEDLEREGSVSFFEEGGSFVSQCGVRIAGQTSRKRDHKSFKLVFAPRYEDRLSYPVFGEEYKVQEFSSLVLRAGLDARYAVFREPFFLSLAMPYKDTTIVQNMRPTVVYVNGEYYGIYYIAESYSEDFYADYYDVSPESVTIIKGYLYDKELEIVQLIEFAAEKDLRVAANYAYLDERIDMDSLIDWAIFQAYYKNADLPGNVRYIKCSERGNKWEFALYDVECGMPFSMPRALASFEYVLNNGQTADLICGLLRNQTFVDKFLTRLAYHAQVTFQRELVLAALEKCKAEIDDEVERNFERWELDIAVFESNVRHMRRLVEQYDRPMQLVDDICSYLDLSKDVKEQYFGALMHG